MANNPNTRNWKDIQMVMAAMAMTLTLGLWNVFAEHDVAAAKESAMLQPTTTPTAEIPLMTGSPTALPPIKIMLGGVAPQVQVVQQPGTHRSGRSSGGGGGGGGGGGAPVARTRSS